MKIYVDTTCINDSEGSFIISYENSEIYFDREHGCLCTETNKNKYILIHAEHFYRLIPNNSDRRKFERRLFAHLLHVIELSQDGRGDIIKIMYLNEDTVFVRYSDYCDLDVDYVITFQDLINEEEMNDEDIC